MRKIRNPVHLDFNRYGDLLLHFFRSSSRPLRDHLHPSVSYVWIGLDGQVVERDHAPDKKEERHAQNNEAVVQSEIDERANHCCPTVVWNSSALVTTRWPGVIPEMISCMSPGSMSPPTTAVRRN